ncbi:MAG: GAF domain-containing sensor histidine kinase [Armatimonadota bacterium]|nr:GAF domain-containing sensor histidine kinase [Armatimonadota bacterium]MCX7777864.1 GAF domain-containing sensor histidine kinase [Armatimonadota bacterium]MDW8025948.1 GAF domain-containing sensor histidine kinase [Armatimonadota bacterium]
MHSEQNEAIERLRRELQQRTRELEAVFRITRALHTQTDLEKMLMETLQTTLDVVNASAGSILLHDPERDELVFRCVIGEKANTLLGMRIPANKGIAGEVFKTGISKLSQDVQRDPTHYRELGERIGYITINMMTVPLTSIEGKPIGVIQILNKRDGEFTEQDMAVTEIMAVLAATAIENARLYEALRLAIVTKMLGDISHDIKNMLTPVMTTAETLQLMFDEFIGEVERLRSEEVQPSELWQRLDAAVEDFRSFFNEGIAMIFDGSTAIQERVREISDCVKGIISKPRFELSNLSDVATKVLQALRPVAEKQGVELRIEVEEPLPQIWVDPKRLYNAIYNLVNNAIPETPHGGSVTVRIKFIGGDAPFPDSNYMLIEVADTGRGMPQWIKERLFTDRAVSTKPGGTGLGTRIVKNVVDAHGGTISVESEEGKGTTFFIKLPVEPPGLKEQLQEETQQAAIG